MSATRKGLSIIGAGHLGMTLGRLWHEHQVFEIADVVTRSAHSATQAAQFIGAGRPLADLNDIADADVFLIATADDQLAPVCDELARAGRFHAGQVVFHCSGALTSAVLGTAAAAGATVASVHPIRSFAQPSDVIGTFAGTWCGTEGEPQAQAVINPAFESIGGRLVSIRPEHKTLYHAAAVFASNYLVTLVDAALLAYEGAGVPRAQALQMVRPLTENTLQNILRVGPDAALSGPIARGDMQTVARQDQALTALRPELGELYRMLARHTAEMVRRSRREDP